MAQPMKPQFLPYYQVLTVNFSWFCLKNLIKKKQIMGRIILKVTILFLFSLLRNTFKPTKPSIYQTIVQVIHFDQNITSWLLMIQIVSFTMNYITIQHISHISNLLYI